MRYFRLAFKPRTIPFHRPIVMPQLTVNPGEPVHATESPVPKRSFSLVTTVFNDRAGCVQFFERMTEQTRSPDEIVLVDALSTDGTWEVIRAELARADRPWKLVAWQERCNVARGRNLAITRAAYPVIASTDIGCDWDPEWLQELVQPFALDPVCQAVMGSWAVRAQDLTSTWARVEYALLREPRLVATPRSDASSRSIAYTRSLWERIGGYPEDLTLAADDMVFSLLLHRLATEPIACAPTVRCYWMRPETFRAFCKEARRNFFGAGEAGLWLSYGLRVGGRLAAELVLLLGGLILAIRGNWLAALLVGFLALVSIGMRVFKLRAPATLAQGLGVDHPFLRLLAFEYATKTYSLLGYWKGLVRGGTTCQNCRAKLRAADV